VFSPGSPQVNQTIVFDASTSHAAAGHTIVKYSWTFGDSTTPVDLTGPTAQHAYAAAASYSVVLIVTDDAGQTASTTKAVTVSAGAGSLTPDFTMSPTNPVSGALVSFNANTSSPLATITRFDWDFGDGTSIPNGGVSINHTYNTPVTATYTIRLTVTDSSNRTATTTKTLAVTAGVDPVAQFTIAPNPTTVGTSVTFDGSASVAGAGLITAYQWNFGDGSPIVSGNPKSHSYAATGTYTITLTVTQTDGRTNSTSHTLLVQ